MMHGGVLSMSAVLRGSVTERYGDVQVVARENCDVVGLQYLDMGERAGVCNGGLSLRFHASLPTTVFQSSWSS